MKEKFADNHFHNILRHLICYQIFLSPQVKRCATITYIHDPFKLSYEFPNGLRLRILEN